MKIERDNMIKQIIQPVYFLFGAACITIQSGYSYASTFLIVIGLLLSISFILSPTLDRNTKLLIYSFILYAFIQGVSIIYDNGSLKEFDRPSRTLMGILIIFSAIKYPPKFIWLINGFAVGAIGAGLRAIWDREISGFSRAFKGMTPIQGGDISIALAILCLCSLMWAIKKQNSKYIIFYSLASIMGGLGSILSLSRGGWVLFPVILFIAYRIFKDWLSTKAKVSLFLIILLTGAILSLPNVGVTKRFESAYNDISLYASGESKNTSLGFRLDIWVSSLYSFIEKPVFGWGNHGVRDSQKINYEKGLIAKSTYDFNSHAHNQFLDEMAKRGIIGLVALLLLFLIPLKLFKNRLEQSKTIEDRTISACGILLIMSTIDFSLSQAFFNHNSGIVFYVVTIVLLYYCNRTPIK